MSLAPTSYPGASALARAPYVAPEFELDWRNDANCLRSDPEAFFPEKGGSTKRAVVVCDRCGVKAKCLEYALAHNEQFGVWGGLSPEKRKKLGLPGGDANKVKRGRKGTTTERDAKIVAARRRHIPVLEVAAMFEVSIGTVYRVAGKVALKVVPALADE